MVVDVSFALIETTAKKSTLRGAQPKQKRLIIQLLVGVYLNKARNIFCRGEKAESEVKLRIKRTPA
ncbi:hypothetical protein OA46_08025 [Enterobacter cloacae]|nr:hypothetical protein OA46_08025 [Enterobacter cloacae]